MKRLLVSYKDNIDFNALSGAYVYYLKSMLELDYKNHKLAYDTEPKAKISRDVFEHTAGAHYCTLKYT